MLERAEFHPLAGRVVTWLVALLTPWVRSEEPNEGDALLAQRADLTVRQHGAQVWIDCTQRVENRSGATIRLCWTVPQPPVASAHAIGVRLGDRAVGGQVCRVSDAESDARRAWDDGRSAVVLWQTGPVASCLAGGWLAPNQTLEVATHHLYALEPSPEYPESALHVQLDAALPLPPAVSLNGVRRAAPFPTASARPRRHVSRRLGQRHEGGAPSRTAAVPPVGPPTLLTGTLARLVRQSSGGFGLHSTARDRAVFRGALAGCATRLLLVQPDAAEAPCATSPAHGRVACLLRAYRDPFRSPAERVRLARDITELGLQYGLVTPWTALLAARGVSGPGGEALDVRAAIG